MKIDKDDIFLSQVYVNSTFSVNKGIPMDSKQTKGQK